jgi:diphosphomevalonate decarboxylase
LAFVKYWGKKDSSLNIPTNGSISMNLSDARTATTVEFDEALREDEIFRQDKNSRADAAFAARTSRHLDRLRALAGVKTRARITTNNAFPAGVGIASSASGMAALTVAGAAALGLDLSERELSAMARLGSGSACRSIPSGFAEWIAGDSHETSYAVTIAPPEHWDILDIAVIVSDETKKLSSSDGHVLAAASPFFAARLDTIPGRLERVRKAILERDFTTFGREIEAEAISLHAIAMTSPHEAGKGWLSGIYYWTPGTMELILAVQQWRQDGLPVYFTLDAGPTVHLLCEAKSRDQVVAAVSALEKDRPRSKAWRLLFNAPAEGAALIEPIKP